MDKVVLTIVTILFIISCAIAHCQEDFSRSYYNNLVRISEIEEAENVMIGDSLVSMHDFEGVANFGIPGDTIDGVRNRLDMARRLHPKVVFILIGANDVIDYSPGRMYKRFFSYVYNPIKKTDSLPIVVTIPYVSSSVPSSEIRNKKIGIYNKYLRERLPHLDLNRATEKDGYLDERYSLDGVHLNDEGYRVFSRMVSEGLVACQDPA